MGCSVLSLAPKGAWMTPELSDDLLIPGKCNGDFPPAFACSTFPSGDRRDVESRATRLTAGFCEAFQQAGGGT